MMVGAPIWTPAAAGELLDLPTTAAPKTAAPAAPATPSAIHSHLCPPPEILCDFVPASAEAERYCEQTIPARVWPLDAVIRISIRPADRFHCIPHALARPSERVVAISVFPPLANAPLGPSSGRRKLTVAPSTGRPVSSVTWTVIP